MSSDKSCKSLSDKYAPVKIRSLVWIACGFWLYTEQGWRFLFDYSAAEDTTEELWNWNSEIKTKAAWWWRNRLYHVGFWRNILRYEKIQEFPPDNLSGPFWKIEIIQEHLRWFWRSAQFIRQPKQAQLCLIHSSRLIVIRATMYPKAITSH